MTRYGYLDQYGHESPYLRVHPGDRLILTLKNGLPAAAENDAMAMSSTSGAAAELCAGASMTATSTHFHFHGLALPPLCHQDDVLRTSIASGDPPFEYRVRIPPNQPPGLYGYHRYLHGFSKAHVLGGPER